MNNRNLSGKFAAGATSGKGSHLFIDGDTVYSYGHHFPIATWARDKSGPLVYFTIKGYSVSTARHKSFILGALCRAGVRVIYGGQPSGGKVPAPTAKEIRERKAEAIKAEALRVKREARRAVRDAARAKAEAKEAARPDFLKEIVPGGDGQAFCVTCGAVKAPGELCADCAGVKK